MNPRANDFQAPLRDGGPRRTCCQFRGRSAPLWLRPILMRNRPEQSDIARQALKLRRERRMTQADLSRITGVAKSDISRFECGRSAPTTRTVDRIAKALGARLVLVPNDWPMPHPGETSPSGAVEGPSD